MSEEELLSIMSEATYYQDESNKLKAEAMELEKVFFRVYSY